MDGNKINEAIQKSGLTVTDFAKKIGISRQAIYGLLKGATPSSDTLAKIGEISGLPLTYLLSDKDYDISIEKLDEPLLFFPEIASIKAGYDGMPQEISSGETVPIPATYISGDKSDYMVFRVTGNSMAPRILDGDQVLVKRQDSVDSGTLAVVLYNGDEATIKKVEYKQGEDWLRLVPYNYEYEAKTISGADLEQCRVIGKVVKLIRSL